MPIGEIQGHVELRDMVLVRNPSLSVQPVAPDEFIVVRELARRDAP